VLLSHVELLAEKGLIYKTMGNSVIFWGRSRRKPGREQTEQPQRYCRHCRAEVRPGRRFCASCGERVGSGTRDFHATRETKARRTRLGQSGSLDAAVHGKTASGTSKSTGSIFQRLYRRFQGLPVVSKAVYLGLSVVGLLVVLSPLTFLAGVALTAASTTVVIVRVFRHKPWKRWALVTVAAILTTLAAGSISNALYGAVFPVGKVQLSEEDQAYVNQVDRLQEAMKQRLDDNARILKKYPSIPPLEQERVYDHYFSDQDLKRTAEEKLKVPPGCEDHYEIWFKGMDGATAALYSDIMLLDAMFVATKEPPWHRSSANEPRRDSKASFEKADQLLNQIRRKGCER
jgi:hypothetical protein